MFSSKCATDEARGIGNITGERWSSQASATGQTFGKLKESIGLFAESAAVNISSMFPSLTTIPPNRDKRENPAFKYGVSPSTSR